ncbi:Nucleotidyltransferase [Rhizodiscina lignyota]|uniref:DNA polymerase n=1 Tax=Rhizodiscina lignyota TaxID=1504668 RepID=A0A9P4M7T9_9PEZI|nr:Nucleotidyltransferase [Rhizodiscina lignyota]
MALEPDAARESGVKLDLSVLPPIFLLPTHIDIETRHELEEKLMEAGALLTYNISEAQIVVGNISTKRRAALELRMRKRWTEEVLDSSTGRKRGREDGDEDQQASNKRLRHESGFVKTKVNRNTEHTADSGNESTESEDEQSTSKSLAREVQPPDTSAEPIHLHEANILPSIGEPGMETVHVVKVSWLETVFEHEKLVPLRYYLIYSGRTIERPFGAPTSTIIERAKDDASASAPRGRHSQYVPALTHGPRRLGAHQHAHHTQSKAKLLQQTTSDYEGSGDEFPEPPEWVKRDIKYACQRSTPTDQANADFIAELKKIKLARLLTGDEIGVRAYSTSIAALAAYPYKVGNPKEILQLPGCDVKIANLWIEWRNNDGKIGAAEEAEEDETMQVLKRFYDIWGVGATTAREFYFDKGWRDLDDIVEFGWKGLTRVQQIGVKYYEEFQKGIPRAEVESIAAVIKDHAIRVRDTGIEVLVVGGYRRGKQESGDVDIVVSHRELGKTANLVTDIVASLETEDWITHTLLLSLTGTHRGQATLPFKGAGPAGHGFDTLDKALVVWQDPNWPGKPKLSKASSRSSSSTGEQEQSKKKKQQAKNSNIHRRVDIIISPWRTVGCAVMGWSGGTTFQRDVRRYAKNVKGWKFDSSGVRDRRTGLAVDLEGPEGVHGGLGMVDAEKKVFEGMGLVWRDPSERCTH